VSRRRRKMKKERKKFVMRKKPARPVRKETVERVAACASGFDTLQEVLDNWPTRSPQDIRIRDDWDGTDFVTETPESDAELEMREEEYATKMKRYEEWYAKHKDEIEARTKLKKEEEDKKRRERIAKLKVELAELEEEEMDVLRKVITDPQKKGMENVKIEVKR
jgi:hypothetical protein